VEEKLVKRVKEAHPEMGKKEVHKEVLRREEQMIKSLSSATPPQASVSKPSMPRSTPSAPANVASLLSRPHHLHGHDMPVMEPHVPDGRAYIPVRADAIFVSNVTGGEIGVIAPTFGSKHPITSMMSVNGSSAAEAVSLTKDSILCDNPASTNGPLVAQFGTGYGTWFGGVDPYLTYALADMSATGAEVDQFGVPEAQLMGGFMEIEVAVPWEGAGLISLIDDSDRISGRNGATISTYEASSLNFAARPTVRVRDLTVHDTIGGVTSNYVPQMLNGLEHRKWVLPICPRHVSNVALAAPAIAGTYVASGSACGATSGCAPHLNPLYGIASAGCGLILKNTGDVDINFIVRVHYEFAVFPVQNTASNTAAASYALLAGKMRQGSANLVAPRWSSATNPPHAVEVAASAPSASKSIASSPPVLAPSQPEHKSFIDKVLSVGETVVGAAEKGYGLWQKIQNLPFMKTAEKVVSEAASLG